MRGESRGRDTQDGREGGRQGRRHPRKMKNTRVHKKKKRDSVKKDIGDNGGGLWMHKGWHYSRKDEPGGVTAPSFV